MHFEGLCSSAGKWVKPKKATTYKQPLRCPHPKTVHDSILPRRPYNMTSPPGGVRKMSRPPSHEPRKRKEKNVGMKRIHMDYEPRISFLPFSSTFFSIYKSGGMNGRNGRDNGKGVNHMRACHPLLSPK